MKISKYYVLALILSLHQAPSFGAEPVNKRNPVEDIMTFSDTKDIGALERHLDSASRGLESPSVTTEALCAILVQTDHFLNENPKPSKTPQLSIAPPGGGLSGIDPQAIADPDERAAYEKLLAENAKLAEAHRTHRRISSVKAKALILLAMSQINRTTDQEAIDAALAKLSKSPQQKQALTRDIKTETANKAQHPTDGVPESEKPKE